MSKISINLLPPEFTQEEVKRGKFYKIQTISISIVLFLIFISVVTLSLRIFQSNRIKVLQTQASEAETRVSAQSLRQAQLVLLKNRLNTIKEYLGTSSKQAEMFNLVDSLLPAGVSVGNVSVGRGGSVLISALAQNAQVLDKLFADLLDQEKNESKIAKVSIEALNRGRDGIYRVSFTVAPTK